MRQQSRREPEGVSLSLTQGGFFSLNWKLLFLCFVSVFVSFFFFYLRQKSLHLISEKKPPYGITFSISYLQVGSQEPLISFKLIMLTSLLARCLLHTTFDNYCKQPNVIKWTYVLWYGTLFIDCLDGIKKQQRSKKREFSHKLVETSNTGK